jgi:hypothetical protein
MTLELSDARAGMPGGIRAQRAPRSAGLGASFQTGRLLSAAAHPCRGGRERGGFGRSRAPAERRLGHSRQPERVGGNPFAPPAPGPEEACAEIRTA